MSVVRSGETDEVNDDVFGPRSSPLRRHFTDVHHGFRVVCVDMEDWRVNDSSHVRAVWR